ncbi:MAG: HEAT repeat domain-containing protein [Planctomycetes bacterium]|nr:HEAT repeat domain-containing protein [Planctomycetota bacterium]
MTTTRPPSTLRARLLGWLLVIVLAWTAQALGWRSLRLRWICNQAINGSEVERREALKTLGEEQDAAVLPTLIQAMRRDDFDDAGCWRAAFAIMRYEGDAVPHLAGALAHEPDPHVRAMAVVILTAMLMERAEPYLTRAQEDREPLVRRWVLLSALNRGLEWELRARLARPAFEDTDPGVRAAAALAVRDRRDATIVAILERQAEGAEPSNLTPRVTAISILARLGYKQYYPRLVAFIQDPHEHAMRPQTVGQYAAESLAALTQFLTNDSSSPELEELGLATMALARETGTSPERAALEHRWTEWWGSNEQHLRWSEREGWTLAAH